MDEYRLFEEMRSRIMDGSCHEILEDCTIRKAEDQRLCLTVVYEERDSMVTFQLTQYEGDGSTGQATEKMPRDEFLEMTDGLHGEDLAVQMNLLLDDMYETYIGKHEQLSLSGEERKTDMRNIEAYAYMLQKLHEETQQDAGIGEKITLLDVNIESETLAELYAEKQAQYVSEDSPAKDEIYLSATMDTATGAVSLALECRIALPEQMSEYSVSEISTAVSKEEFLKSIDGLQGEELADAMTAIAEDVARNGGYCQFQDRTEAEIQAAGGEYYNDPMDEPPWMH